MRKINKSINYILGARQQTRTEALELASQIANELKKMGGPNAMRPTIYHEIRKTKNSYYKVYDGWFDDETMYFLKKNYPELKIDNKGVYIEYK